MGAKLKVEMLNGEIFTTMREARMLIEHSRRHYNWMGPRSSIGDRPPASEAVEQPVSGLAGAERRADQELAEHCRVLT